MNAITQSRLLVTHAWMPDSLWVNHIRAFFVRNTQGCHLKPNKQLNRFPAHSYCLLTWYLKGEAELLSCGGLTEQVRLASCVVSGCQSYPLVFKNCGEIYAFTVMFYPEAFHALFGVDMASLHNRFADAREVLPPHGLALIEAVFQADTDEARQHLVEHCLSQYGTDLSSNAWVQLRHSGSQATLASASTLFGVSQRQLRRLALREIGLNFQTLINFWRGEAVYFRQKHFHLIDKTVPLADFALGVGFADQSHWIRNCKAHTHRTPTQLAYDIRTEEADWFYRLPLHPHGGCVTDDEA